MDLPGSRHVSQEPKGCGNKEEKDYNNLRPHTLNRAGDWILELFAPSYATVSDALEVKQVTEEVPRITVVSAFDPQSVKNVYERVHLMLSLDAELKSEQVRTTDSAVKSAPHTNGEAHSKEAASVDLGDSNIWNSEELSVLRNVFRAARSQICGLEVRLQQTQRHNEELEEKVASVSVALETKSRKLSEATKANHRLKIHCEELQKENVALEMRLNAVTDMWKEIDGEKLRMIKETQQIRIALDRERLARQQLQLQLEETQQEMIREKRLAEDMAKTCYEQHLMQIKKQVKQLEEELATEKEMHAKDRKALDHLRAHFSSLPLCDILPSNVVDTDQVKDIDHLAL